MQLLCDTPSRECDVVLFLELNGYRFNANEEDAAQVFLELASGTSTKQALSPFFILMHRSGKNETASPFRDGCGWRTISFGQSVTAILQQPILQQPTTLPIFLEPGAVHTAWSPEYLLDRGSRIQTQHHTRGGDLTFGVDQQLIANIFRNIEINFSRGNLKPHAVFEKDCYWSVIKVAPWNFKILVKASSPILPPPSLAGRMVQKVKSGFIGANKAQTVAL
jgi:hypothetical protein